MEKLSMGIAVVTKVFCDTPKPQSRIDNLKNCTHPLESCHDSSIFMNLMSVSITHKTLDHTQGQL